MNSGVIVALAGAALATYFTRFPLMLLSGKWNVPLKLDRFLSFIAPAVLTALIAPAVVIRQGRLDISLSNKYIVAAIVTVIVSYFSKNMLASVITGVCTVGMLMYIL
jgi:branched-subunit amino acid transport protein